MFVHEAKYWPVQIVQVKKDGSEYQELGTSVAISEANFFN